jgi:hypothetical protein
MVKSWSWKVHDVRCFKNGGNSAFALHFLRLVVIARVRKTGGNLRFDRFPVEPVRPGTRTDPVPPLNRAYNFYFLVNRGFDRVGFSNRGNRSSHGSVNPGGSSCLQSFWIWGIGPSWWRTRLCSLTTSTKSRPWFRFFLKKRKLTLTAAIVK